jgi:tRNA(Ile)-lysidine synthase
LNKLSISFPYIQEIISRLPSASRLWVAYSGGVDSSVLLNLLSSNREKLKLEIVAVHVNHQLSPVAENWVKHCKNICEKENIRFETITINAIKPKGHSQEAYARTLRYAALEKMMSKDDLLLTGHHKDDQAETLIQQLMRGAGPDGLAAMPAIRKFGQGWLVRPLLDFSRKQIKDYAEHHGIKWIEDESNQDTEIDRNYIRNNVIPCLQERWPSVINILSRSAEHQAEVVNLLRDVAEQDYEKARGEQPHVLDIVSLKNLPEARMKNVIRYWLKKNGHQSASTSVMDIIIGELIFAGDDRGPMVNWHETEIRRYRNHIYVMKPVVKIPLDIEVTWNLEQPLEIDSGHLMARRVMGKGLKSVSINDNIVQVRYRRGGETIRPAGRKETHKLKKLFQEAGVPPWQRDRVPLIYINNKLALVTDYWIDESFNAAVTEQGWEISLTQH